MLLPTGGDRGVRRVSVRRLLPGAGHHRGRPRADPAAPAHRGRGSAGREGGGGAPVLPGQEDERRARGGPQVPHPVPEGLPAAHPRAVQRPHRAADPGDAALDHPAQPRPAAGGGARQARGRQGREGQDAAARGGGGLPRGRRGQDGGRGAARDGRDRLRRRVPDRGDPPGPAGRDRAEPHQAGPRPGRPGPARPHRPPRLRPGDARGDRGREAAQERRPQGGAAPGGPDGGAGAAHRQPGEPHEDDGGDGRAHPHLQQEAHGAGAQRARLPRRLRRLRPALGGAGAARAVAVGLPVRHRQLQELQRHERPPRGRQAAAGAGRPRE